MTRLLIQRNLPAMAIEQYRATFTFPARRYYEELGFDLSYESFEDLSRQFIANYEARRHECSLYPYARLAVAQINASGMGQSILSAYLQETLNELVQAFALEHVFERLVGLDDIYARSKIEQGRFWMKELGYSKLEVLLIGDTIHDFEVAEAIGADCILVAHGHNSKERLQHCGAPVVDSIRELIQDHWINLKSNR